MSILSEITRISGNVSAALAAISRKGVRVPAGASSDSLESLINAINDGNPDETKPVKFIDYDGTVLYTYTVAELQTLSAMPANPVHQGLTAQGWNWSLSDAKAQLTSMPAAGLTIGQMYKVTDGKTRIFISIEPNTPAARRVVYVRCTPTVANGVTIDWGDSTTPTVTDSASAKNYTHTYAENGTYTITVTVTSGKVSFEGDSSNAIYGPTSQANAYNRCRIRSVWIGNNVTGIGRTFTYCFAIRSVMIPYGLTSITAQNTFLSCVGLKGIVFPTTITSSVTIQFSSCSNLMYFSAGKNFSPRGTYFQNCSSLLEYALPAASTEVNSNVFYGNYSLKNAILPPGTTSIGAAAYYGCISLTTVTIPASVTSIGAQAFQNCYGVKEYHMLPTSPPALSDSNTFTNIASDCVIYVPRSANQTVLNNYKTAQYWSTYASRMQEEPAA